MAMVAARNRSRNAARTVYVTVLSFGPRSVALRRWRYKYLAHRHIGLRQLRTAGCERELRVFGRDRPVAAAGRRSEVVSCP